MASGQIIEPKKDPLIFVQLNRLDSAIGRMSDLQDHLLKKLEPISSIEPQNEVMEKRQPYNVPLAEQLADLIDRIDSICRKTENANRCLEI